MKKFTLVSVLTVVEDTCHQQTEDGVASHRPRREEPCIVGRVLPLPILPPILLLHRHRRSGAYCQGASRPSEVASRVGGNSPRGGYLPVRLRCHREHNCRRRHCYYQEMFDEYSAIVILRI